MAPRTTRLVIADDSAVMRSLLRSVMRTAEGFEIVGIANNGEAALGLIEQLRPDLVLLDVEMPVMDGLTTLRTLRARGLKVPVIMCSSLTQRGARVTLEALASGASDYVAKPRGEAGPAEAIQALARELVPKMVALTTAVPAAIKLPASRPPLPADAPLTRAQSNSSPPSVLLIGVSTGGPAALDVLLPALPASFPLPVLIVQHMPELFTRLLAERLDTRCALRVSEAAEGDEIGSGRIAIARGNWHLEVVASSRAGQRATLHLSQAPPENHCRPAVDVLFRTAAAHYGSGTVGVVLTGMGSDGLAGSRIIRARGGLVLAQDQPTSAIWGMPGAVVNAGLAHRVLPIQEIAPELIRQASAAARGRAEVHEVVA
jgi:two-component system chemotaxis response regulator CheB